MRRPAPPLPSTYTIIRANESSQDSPKVFPGDIVILKMGDTVPADLRLFDAMNLACDEQSLTGEAAPVEKVTENNILVPGSEKVARTDIEVGVADRVNLAYGTTVVRKGRGRGIVIATGMDTEVGKIAASTSRKRRKPGRSMSFRKYGPRQPIIGLLRRAWDVVGKFLGLTVCAFSRREPTTLTTR